MLNKKEGETVQMYAIVRGRVQGVGFRWTTQYFAGQLGIIGTVRNMHDGSVEIYAQGPMPLLTKLVEQLKGEIGLGIESFNTEFSPPNKIFQNFKIVH